MEEGKDRGRRPELVGGGLTRSRGGWSEVLSLKRQGERVEYDGRILGGGDFVSDILLEPDQRIRRYLPIREKGLLKERIIKSLRKCARRRDRGGRGEAGRAGAEGFASPVGDCLEIE